MPPFVAALTRDHQLPKVRSTADAVQ
eukprot:COSAG01_NODE_62904_length_282_cov_0.912568_1_plen_25_part_01